ncbi:MAG: hypothetical protein KBT20_10140 [Bacteroidales bacterium]|nr:hypothetical protein [Candidatus Liminaster caballi]
MINIDRIFQTKIPDIHPAYGGVRGRTMSSRHQSYAWPALVEAGVKRVIDLREYMTEQNGVEPIPMEIFKERKTVIRELSKEKSEHEEIPLKRVYVDMDGVLS